MTQEEFHKRYQYNPTADCLGEGGFGKVYKAYDTHRDRYVAIKMAEVRPHLEDVRLRKEVEIISKLPSHPNIAYYEECYTFSTFAGEYDFGVLQYYEEGNLQQLLTDKQLSYEQKDNLLRQILEGIVFLHSQGIIHRDLKPQNILIVNRNGKYIPKITDFGISKKLDENKSSIFTNSLAGAGTLSFASPEQLMGNTIRKNTDLWSFGVIACWAFTGKLPFNTGEQAVTSEAGRIELFKQITSGDITSIIQLLPASWRNLLNHCLKVDIDNRISSASKCLEMLDGKVEAITKEPLSEDTTIDEAIIIARTSETEAPVVKEIEVGKPATNQTVIDTQTNERENPTAKEIEVEKPVTNEIVTITQTNETGSHAANEMEVVESINNETKINKQTNNNASSTAEIEVVDTTSSHVDSLPVTQSEPKPILFEPAPDIINYTPWIIFFVVIVVGIIISFAWRKGPSEEEKYDRARQDSIERQRIHDSISVAVNAIGSSVTTALNSNPDSNPKNTNEVSQKIKVGQVYEGGIVFYLDATKEHGLVASTKDQGNWYWGCLNIPISGTSVSIGKGKTNTETIVFSCRTPGQAARICEELILNGYNDWFLPSKDELNLMYKHRKIIGGFADSFYWSSSKSDYSSAWIQSFGNGSQGTANCQNNSFSVRAIRAF